MILMKISPVDTHPNIPCAAPLTTRHVEYAYGQRQKRPPYRPSFVPLPLETGFVNPRGGLPVGSKYMVYSTSRRAQHRHESTLTSPHLILRRRWRCATMTLGGKFCIRATSATVAYGAADRRARLSLPHPSTGYVHTE